MPPEDPEGDKSDVRGTWKNMGPRGQDTVSLQGPHLPRGLKGQEGQEVPQARWVRAGPGRRNSSGQRQPHLLPMTLTPELGHSPVLAVLSLQAPPAKNPETLWPHKRTSGSSAPCPQAKPTWAGHLGAQPHRRVMTSQGGGRCNPGVNVAERSSELCLLATCPHTLILTFRPEGPWGPVDPARP